METPPTFSGGDGAAGSPPQPGAPVDVGAVMLQILEESKRQTAEQEKQTAIAERSEKLLHRILLGDLDQLDSADVMAAIGVARTKLGEMRDDGLLPMYQRPGSERWYIGRDTFRTVVRGWQERFARR